jgi:GGDEF domain-containing protein
MSNGFPTSCIMKKLRLWLIILASWLFVVFNLERLSPALELAPFVYVLVLIAVIETLLLLAFMELSPATPLLLILPLYVLLKTLFEGSLLQAELPLAVIEATLLAGTVLITNQVAQRVNSLERSWEELLLGHVPQQAQPFETGQGQLYRELRRARHYQHPASLLAITVTQVSFEHAFDRFLAELQRETTKKYVRARVADFLVQELRDCDLVARRDGHFVALLPETGVENVEAVVQRLEGAAAARLGLEIQVGTAVFPDEAVTFETLLERAEARMFGWLEQPAGSQPDSAPASPELVERHPGQLPDGGGAVAKQIPANRRLRSNGHVASSEDNRPLNSDEAGE